MVTPGENTRVRTRVALVPRRALEDVGIAPLTSMYWFGPSDGDVPDDYRLAVHDSDGLQMVTGNGERLWRALAKDLGPYQRHIDDMHLVDFRVRITGGGTEAATRVIIDSADGQGHRWSTVGVSPNIVDASFEALTEAIRWKLVRDGVTPA